MKVFGWTETYRGQSRRVIVLARSKKRVNELRPGLGPAFCRDFMTDTGNDAEIAAAHAAGPEVFLRAKADAGPHRHEYEPIADGSR